MVPSVKHTITARTRSWAAHAIYGDRNIIVFNKPPGLVCQRTASSPSKQRGVDKFDDLLHDLKDRFRLGNLPYPIHRLDKATTGALVLAKNISAARQLAHQFQTRAVEKTYLALVRGGSKSFPARCGEIRDAIQVGEGACVSLSESCDAKFAATDWELIASSPTVPLSLLRLRLNTGLKHQLRIHLAHSLHVPILGDTLYSRKPTSEQVARLVRIPPDRVFLHASRLVLSRFRRTGPRKHVRLGIAAALPGDFVAVCQAAGIPLDSVDVSGGLFVDDECVSGDVMDLQGEWLRPLRYGKDTVDLSSFKTP